MRKRKMTKVKCYKKIYHYIRFYNKEDKMIDKDDASPLGTEKLAIRK